jgi:uncharacterized integral membrane protein
MFAQALALCRNARFTGGIQMNKVKWTLICVIAGLLAILLLQNTEPVETRIFFTSLVMPRAFLLLATAVLGFFCGIILTLVVTRKRK